MSKDRTDFSYYDKKYMEFPVKYESRLMEFLMKEMYGVSRNRVKDLLRGHAVSIDKKLTTQFDTEVHPGQIVRITRQKKKTELVNKLVKIIYEDHDIVVVHKSEGILSMASSPAQHCVKKVLDDYFQKRHFKCTAHVVHRLDRETSGLIIYAKNVEIQQLLVRDWQHIVSDRRYVAVVSGKLEKEGGTIRSWLKETKSFVTVSSPVDNGGKEAITHFRTMKTSSDFSLVELKLQTGRKNQIRVHMKDIGFPVLGDSKYGNGKNPLGRLCLHAFRLNFTHPRTGEFMEFEVPVPQSFIRLFEDKTTPESIE